MNEIMMCSEKHMISIKEIRKAGPIRRNRNMQQVNTLLAKDEAIARRLQQVWDEAGKWSTFAMLDRDNSLIDGRE